MSRIRGSAAIAAMIYFFSFLLSLLLLVIYIIGTAKYLTDVEDNTCDMTYMFEYPQYVKVSLDDEVEERYPRFGLYAYGEGFVTQKLRRMKFSGIPVLFVPGNGGSHEQARSLASVSLRKSIDDRTPFHFDYFTVSLGKDYSALYGGVLEDETSYVTLCISRILSLYGGKPDQIVLIGHSMGGIIAKGALLRSHSINPDEPSKNRSSVSILLTMASPHNPIFLPDREISRYYRELEKSRHEFDGMNTTIVSIGGGERDILVGTSQTIYSSGDINVVASGIPDVWKSTDHLCILWCKQLVLTIVRGLFDCVDKNARPPKIISDSDYKLRALSYHFTSRSSGKKFRSYDDRENFERGAQWIEDIRGRYTWSSKNFKEAKNKSVFIMIRLDSPSYDSFTLESFNLEAKDWLFACSASAIEGNSRVCEWGWNLTNRTILSPDPMHRSRKKITINIEALRKSIGAKLSHVVVRIASSELRGKKSNVKINVDLYKARDRWLKLEDSSNSRSTITRFFLDYPLSGILTPNPQINVDSSPRGALIYKIDLSGIDDSIIIEIQPIIKNEAVKKSENSDENPHAILELLYSQPKKNNSVSGQIRLINFNDGEIGKKQRTVMNLLRNQENTLMVNLGADYSYRLTIRRADIINRVACLVRDRWPIIYPIIIGISLIGIATRIDNSYEKTGLTCAITIILSLIVNCIFETFVAIGLIHVFAIIICCLFVFFGSVAHNVIARFVSRIAAIPNLWFDWLIGGLDRLPIITTFVLFPLISVTCGALAILLTVGLFFLKLTRIYDEYVEELLMASLRQINPFSRSKRKRKGKEQEENKVTTTTTTTTTISATSSAVLATNKNRLQSIFDSILLFITWSLTAISAIPSALVWAKNFKYEMTLTTEEPTMLLSWIVMTIWACLGFLEIPATDDSNNYFRRLLTGTVFRISGWTLIYTASLENSAHYQWIVPPVVAFSITILSLFSLFTAKKSN